MANRVVLGQRQTSEFGFFVSKPGVDVMSAAESNLLISSNSRAWQLIQTGTVNVPNGTSVAVNIPNQGFYPYVMFFRRITDLTPNDYFSATIFAVLKYNSMSQIAFFNNGGFDGSTTNITYGVTRIPVASV